MVEELRTYTVECGLCGYIVVADSKTRAEFLLKQHIEIAHMS